MSGSRFPITAERVVATVAEVLRHQGSLDLVEVLATSAARIERSYYDEILGTTHYNLLLDVPIPLYARIEPQLAQIEGAIAGKIQSAIKSTGNHRLSAVVIAPVLQEPMSSASRRVDVTDLQRLWEPRMFRLFLSHVALHKVAVSNLKTQLAYAGVSGFVAHEDIEPALEWQEEIDLALRSMEAMAVLLTPEFHESRWTDQEVGVAMARGVPIIPVKLGLDPYGFIGKHQALRGDLMKPKELAADLVSLLARRPGTGPAMREALVHALETSSSYSGSIVASLAIVEVLEFTKDQIRRIEASIANNSQVAEAFGVPARLSRLVADSRSASTTLEGPQ